MAGVEKTKDGDSDHLQKVGRKANGNAKATQATQEHEVAEAGKEKELGTTAMDETAGDGIIHAEEDDGETLQKPDGSTGPQSTKRKNAAKKASVGRTKGAPGKKRKVPALEEDPASDNQDVEQHPKKRKGDEGKLDELTEKETQPPGRYGTRFRGENQRSVPAELMKKQRAKR